QAASSTSIPTETLTATPSSTATPVLARVDSPTGVVVRAEPDPNSQIVTYINDGVEIQMLGEQVLADNLAWEKVIAPDGSTGWIVGRYLLTATPAD
ncbi:MAG: SH3 domain-containing protein, partial [Anaerolineaceae bacterium]